MSFELGEYTIAYSVERDAKNTLVIVPILNEGERILSQLVKMDLLSSFFDIVIVDGNSNDGSVAAIVGKKFKHVRAILVDQSGLGLSRQIQLGLSYGVESRYKYVVTMDGNDKDHPQGIRKILDALNLGNDFIQGSRFTSGGAAINNPKIRTLAIRLLHAPITSLFANRRFTDTTNGFRGFSLELITDPEMRIMSKNFKSYELVAFIPVRAARLRYKMAEVGVIREYPSGAIPTKIVGFKGNFKILKTLITQSIAARRN